MKKNRKTDLIPDEQTLKRDEFEKYYWRDNFRKIVKDWRLYLLLLPLIFVFFCWRYMPMYELLVAFKAGTKEGVSVLEVNKQDFVGFQWFKQMMFGSQAADFWRAFRNTFAISFYGLVFGFPIPIIIALFFNEIKSDIYRSVLQVFTYLPKFVSTVVMTSLVWLLLKVGSDVSSCGILSTVLVKLGLLSQEAANSGVLYAPKYFRAVYIISGIWEGSGYGSIVYFAAIIGISPTNYEAAQMDGANKMAQIRYVVLPGILSTISIMLILRLGNLLSVGYEKVLLLYKPQTWETADVVSTYAARLGGLEAGGGSLQGLASAAEMLSSVIAMLLVIGSNMISKRVSDTSLY
ncbi:MAG: sugar ABC transporter permease [Lachnospiraceae bacterium]|nr:sugar ABC transporter permease [Lachnospiraceae bacterium]